MFIVLFKFKKMTSKQKKPVPKLCLASSQAIINHHYTTSKIVQLSAVVTSKPVKVDVILS
jgi:hypothetical protein